MRHDSSRPVPRPAPRAVPRPRTGRLHVTAVVGPYPTLSETFVTDQIARLEARGVQVSVIGTPAPDGEGAVHPGTLVPRRGFPLGSAPQPVRSLAQHVRRRTAALALRRRAPQATVILRDAVEDPFLRWRFTETLLPLLESAPPDVFHAHFGWFGAQLVEIRRALGWRIPIVTSFHGADVSTYVARHGRGVYDRLFADGDLLLPVSEHWRRELLALGAPPDRTVVQHMGIDLTRFTPRRTPRRADDAFQLLSVGRLVPKKGFIEGLRAVAELHRRGTDVRYTIVGDGPERAMLERAAARSGIGDRVRFLGARPHEEVLRLFARHEVLLCPSVTGPDGDQEGIPVVLMEAMATAMPVVASRHSGIPELVEDGLGGLLADEHDHIRLADHLERIADDADLAARLGVRARAKVASEFDGARLAARLQGLLEDVASAPRTAPAPGDVT